MAGSFSGCAFAFCDDNAMTQAVRHIIIMVWGTGLALGYFACIARALRVARNGNV